MKTLVLQRQTCLLLRHIFMCLGDMQSEEQLPKHNIKAR